MVTNHLLTGMILQAWKWLAECFFYAARQVGGLGVWVVWGLPIPENDCWIVGFLRVMIPIKRESVLFFSRKTFLSQGHCMYLYIARVWSSLFWNASLQQRLDWSV